MASSSAPKNRSVAIRTTIVVTLSFLILVASAMAIQEIFVPQGDFTSAIAKAPWGDWIERWNNSGRDFALAFGAIQSRPGDTITLRDPPRAIRLTAVPFKNKNEYTLAVCAAVAATIVTLVVAAILVLIWFMLCLGIFFAFSLAVPVFMLPAGTPPVLVNPWLIFISLASAASVAGLVIFLACFPGRSVDEYSWRIWVVRLAIAAAVAMVIFQTLLPSGTTLRGISLVNGRSIGVAQLFIDSLYLLGAIAFATNYVESNARDRQRISWVFVAIVVAIGGLVPELLTFVIPSAGLRFLFIALSFVANIHLPIAVAYSVLHHRVLDVRIAVSCR